MILALLSFDLLEISLIRITVSFNLDASKIIRKLLVKGNCKVNCLLVPRDSWSTVSRMFAQLADAVWKTLEVHGCLGEMCSPQPIGNVSCHRSSITNSTNRIKRFFLSHQTSRVQIDMSTHAASSCLIGDQIYDLLVGRRIEFDTMFEVRSEQFRKYRVDCLGDRSSSYSFIFRCLSARGVRFVKRQLFCRGGRQLPTIQLILRSFRPC